MHIAGTRIASAANVNRSQTSSHAILHTGISPEAERSRADDPLDALINDPLDADACCQHMAMLIALQPIEWG